MRSTKKYNPTLSHGACRRGFSFVEVLFAIMILGIGAIMLAGLFPVAIRQGQTSFEESVGASVVKGGALYMQHSVSNALLPVTPADNGFVQAFGDTPPTPPAPVPTPATAWDGIKGNFIVPADRRFAWVPLYRRQLGPTLQPLPMAQLFVIGVEVRNTDFYGPQDVTKPAANNPATLQARKLHVQLAAGPPGVIRFEEIPGLYGVPAIDAVAEGAFVVIANNPIDPNGNGRIYRVGGKISGTAADWNLQPSHDLGSAAENIPFGGSNWADAFIVGRGYKNPADPSQRYTGLAQDVAIYTTVVSIPTTP